MNYLIFYYYVWIVIYSVWLVAIDTYPEVLTKCTFYYYYWEQNYVQLGSASGNYTIFGFCHDLLNSANSVTFI